MLNVLLYLRNDRRRMQLRVNNQTFSKRDFHDWMELHYGTATQAQMIQYYLVKQAAEKAGIKPDSAEIEEMVKEREEADPRLASELKFKPWTRSDMVMTAETNLGIAGLTTKDVVATDDEIKGFYQTMGSSRWDEPTKFYTRLIVCQDREAATRAKELLDQMAARAPETKDEKGNAQKLIPDLTLLQQQLAPKVGLLYGEGKKVYTKPFSQNSQDPIVNKIASMKLGQSEVFPNGTQGFILLLLEKRVEGKQTTLSDPKVRRRVERDFKSTRGVPAQEEMRKLWDAADIQTDPEGMKAEIERVILPERAKQQQKQQSAP